VRSLLDELGILHACASAFDKEKVDLAALAGLADGNLQALGVVRLGDRRGLKVRAQALLASTMGWSGLGEEKPGVRDADDGDPLPSSSKLLPGKVAVQNWADATGTEMHKKDENRPEEPAFTTVRRSGVDYRDPRFPSLSRSSTRGWRVLRRNLGGRRIIGATGKRTRAGTRESGKEGSFTDRGPTFGDLVTH